MKKLFTLLLMAGLAFISYQSNAQRVLIIYDDDSTNTNSVSLQTALQNEGYTVEFSTVSETLWDNSNPSVTGYDVVIHLNGTTYSSDMPTSGQNALVDFVQNNKGLFVSMEWSAYEFLYGRMQNMQDLILFDRQSGHEGFQDLVEDSNQSSHFLLVNVDSVFTLHAGFNDGQAHFFATDPVTVVMHEGSNDAVGVRDFGNGHVLGFSMAGNYNGYPALSDVNIQQIIINFIDQYYTSCVAQSSNITETACDSYTAPDGAVYTTSGTYDATILNGSGCDSTITIDLTVNYSSSNNIQVTACNSYTAPDGQVYTTSGVYGAKIANSVGCDSLITIDLTVNYSSTSNIQVTACNTYTAPDAQV